MPYIDEKELEELQEKIDKERQANNRLLNQIKIQESTYSKTKSSTTIIKLIAAMLGVFFFGLVGIIVFMPNLLLGVPIINGIEELDNEREVFLLQDSIIQLDYRVDSLRKVIAKRLKDPPTIKEIKKNTSPPPEDKRSKYVFEKTAYDKYFKTKNVYSVQIGAFKKRNLLLMSRNFVNFKGFKNKDYFMYSLGNFGTKAEAEKFRNELIKMGFRDAFITPYKF